MLKKKTYLAITGDPGYDTWALLRQTSTLVDKCLEQHCRHAGLSVTAYQTLQIVKRVPKPLSALKLSRMLDHQHHSTIELVNRLMAKGLLIRTTVDGKPSLEITEKGNELLDQVASMNCTDKIVENLDNDQLEQLKNGLKQLREAATRELGIADLGEIILERFDEEP